MVLAATQYPKTEVSSILDDPDWPEFFPLSREAFQRYDEAPDTEFYSSPRFVTHIDDPAIGALTKWYQERLPPSGTDASVLDMCSSWISHFPKQYSLQGRVAGVGMNEEELKRNPQLTEFAVQDLNNNPKLPYPDNTFDAVVNAVSVDYLTRPLEVFQEVHRVLKPGGLAAFSFSNRCFPTKAIAVWTASGDPDHVWIVGSYFHYSVSGGFTAPACDDISPKPGRSDPMYVVYARKK